MVLGLGISLLMMFSAVFTSEYSNKNYQIKNILTLSMTMSVALLFLFKYFIDYELLSFNFDKFIFFKNPLFYVVLILNFSAQFIARAFAKSNEENLMFVQFSNFVVIAIVPLFSFLFMYVVSFEKTVEISYKSLWEIICFSLILFILSFLLFFDKIKNKTLKRKDLMILHIVVSAAIAVSMVKMMQEYNTEAFYFCTIVFNSFLWIFFAVKNGEVHKVEARHYRIFPLFAIIYITYSYLNIMLVEYFPVEHITILRSLSAIIASTFFDSLRKSCFALSTKDFIILILVFSTLFAFN